MRSKACGLIILPLSLLIFAAVFPTLVSAQIAQRETLYVDDSHGEPYYAETGTTWATSIAVGWNGAHRYIVLDDPININQTARWTPSITTPGYYVASFYLPWTSNSRNHAMYIVSASGSSPDSSWHDQNDNSGNWINLGVYHLSEGADNYVEVVNDSTSTSGYIFRADATRFILGPDQRDIEPGRRNGYAYGEVAVPDYKDWVLRIYNIGGTILTVNQVTFETSAFSLHEPSVSVNIDPRDYQDFTICFLPFVIKTYVDTMRILSNDGDEPTIAIPLMGEGVSQFVVVNNEDGAPGYVEEVGFWQSSNGTANCPGIVNLTSRYTIQSTNPGARATYTPDIPFAGHYRIEFALPLTSAASDHALYVICPGGGAAPDSVWMDQNSNQACEWRLLGSYYLVQGTENNVSVINDGTGFGYVLRTDLMKFVNIPDFPLIYLPSNYHSFTDISIDEAEEWSFSIQNKGSADMTIFNIINISPDAFTLVSPTSFPVVVPGLDSITSVVSFQPSSIATFKDTLWIISDAANYETLGVYLDGNGIGNWVQVDDSDTIGFTIGHYESGVPIVEDTTWQLSTSLYGINGTSLYTTLLWHPDAFCKWVPYVPQTGIYDVYASSVPSRNCCDRTPYFIHYSPGLVDTVQVDQNTTTPDNVWIYLGRYEFEEGAIGCVEVIIDTAIIHPTPADEVVVRADAIKLLEAPTGVFLSSFFAGVEGETVRVHWSTSDPYHLHSFNLYRLSQKGACPEPADRINEKTIRGQSPYIYVDSQVKPGEVYYYWLQDIDETGASTFHGPIVADLSGLVAVTYQLSQNYPNPFNPKTEIRYQLPVDSHVGLKIFNTLGQKVRTLVDGKQMAGEYRLIWNGQSDSNQDVANGLYFCRLKAGGFSKTIKMVLVK